MFDPKFKVSPAIEALLTCINANQDAIYKLRNKGDILPALQQSSRLKSTFYSTQIEGNLLTEPEVKSVSQGATFPNRNRDTNEVKNYFNAAEHLADLASDKSSPITEADLRVLNEILCAGFQKPRAYRDRKNVVRDRKDGQIVTKSGSASLLDLISWLNISIETKAYPVPIIAALAHHHIATTHPYFDGNGHTARLLALLVLNKSEFAIHETFLLDAFYASDIQAYYDALTVDESHNFYFGSATADLTDWIAYFCDGLARALTLTAKTLKNSPPNKITGSKKQLRRNLDRRQQQVVSLFSKHRFLTTLEIAELFELHRRTSLNLCKKWVDEGFLIQHGNAKKTRKYELADPWLSLI